jgi:tyrosyl-tRNA synthetase
MFGKIMSVSDELMWRYFELLSFKPMTEVNQWRQDVVGGANPKNIKVSLAKEIVARFHTIEAAQQAEQDFAARFQRNEIPENLPEQILTAPNGHLLIANLLKQANLVSSTSDALRMIDQGAVKIDGEKVSDQQLQVKSGTSHVYQVGKRRFAKITLQ